MSSQLHVNIENVFLLLCYTFPAVDSQIVVEEHRRNVPSGIDVLSGLTAVGLLIGLNIVGMKWPPILDRLGTLILSFTNFTVHVCTDLTGLVHYFTKRTHATARSPRSSTHTHCHSRSHMHYSRNNYY